VNATSLVVGGSTAKQIDCGSGSYGNGSSVSFHFTFNNVPNVVVMASAATTWAPSYLVAFNAGSITTTGFTVSAAILSSGSSTISTFGSSPISWIAIG